MQEQGQVQGKQRMHRRSSKRNRGTGAASDAGKLTVRAGVRVRVWVMFEYSQCYSNNK